MFKKEKRLSGLVSSNNQSMQVMQNRREDCKAWYRLQPTLKELECSS